MNDFQVRRLPEGPIDIDFYRKRGHGLRRDAISKTGSNRVVGRSVLAGIVLAFLALGAAALHSPPGAQIAGAASETRTR